MTLVSKDRRFAPRAKLSSLNNSIKLKTSGVLGRGNYFISFCLLLFYDQSSWQSSHCLSSFLCAHFYGTEIEIWAGLGPVGNTENKIWGQL